MDLIPVFIQKIGVVSYVPVNINVSLWIYHSELDLNLSQASCVQRAVLARVAWFSMLANQTSSYLNFLVLLFVSAH